MQHHASFANMESFTQHFAQNAHELIQYIEREREREREGKRERDRGSERERERKGSRGRGRERGDLELSYWQFIKGSALLLHF